jgi:hypothetical protein
MKTARKTKVVAISQLSEDDIKEKVMELKRIKTEMKILHAQYEVITKELIAHLGNKAVRQYDTLKFCVITRMARSIQWKKEAGRLAKLLYPHVKEFRKYLTGLARRNPKKPSKPFVQLFELKEGAEQDEL